jgi:hypothetical protein
VQSSTTSLHSNSTVLSEADKDIHMGGAATRAAKLKRILARARERAQGYVAAAEAQVAQSTLTHRRIQDIRRVLAGGADAAFSLSADTADSKSSGPARAPHRLRVQTHSVDLSDLRLLDASLPPSPYGSVSVSGSEARRLQSVPLEELLAGVEGSDPQAAAEFAAQYGTAAAATRLGDIKGLISVFRAELEEARSQQARAQRRASEGSAGGGRSTPTHHGKRPMEVNRSPLSSGTAGR